MKVNHYARPVKTEVRTSSESIILQLFFGSVSTGFAIAGYNAQVPQILIPCGVVALLCWGLILYSVYSYFEEKNYQKKQAKLAEQAESNESAEQPSSAKKL